MISLLVTVVIIGFVCWLLVTLVPLPEPFPRIVIAIACIIVLLMVLRAFGIWDGGFGGARIR